jgi:hypothetical protein
MYTADNRERKAESERALSFSGAVEKRWYMYIPSRQRTKRQRRFAS